MSVAFELIPLTGPIAAFPTTPQFKGLTKGSIAVVLYTTTAGVEVEISLDGANLHGKLLAGVIHTVTFDANTYENVWLRTASVGAISVGVGIESTGLR